jgi:hypothetical protein
MFPNGLDVSASSAVGGGADSENAGSSGHGSATEFTGLFLLVGWLSLSASARASLILCSSKRLRLPSVDSLPGVTIAKLARGQDNRRRDLKTYKRPKDLNRNHCSYKHLQSYKRPKRDLKTYKRPKDLTF